MYRIQDKQNGNIGKTTCKRNRSLPTLLFRDLLYLMSLLIIFCIVFHMVKRYGIDRIMQKVKAKKTILIFPKDDREAF